MTRPTGLDQSWGFADPKAAAKAGVQVVSMYLSWDPTKNITARDVKAYHKAGIGVILNWENNAGAPLLGAGQGRADAKEAVRQARQLIVDVGYAPKIRLNIYFSCDRDVNAGQYGPIFAYYRDAKSICQAAGFGVGVYGEAALVSALAKARITDAEWQSSAWSGGALSPDADFYQYLNGQKLGGSDVDFDRIIHPVQLGAWWPPGNPYDSSEDDMPLSDQDVQKVATATVKMLLATELKQPDGKPWVLPSWIIAAADNSKKALAAVQAIEHVTVPVDIDATAAAIQAELLKRLGGQP